MQLKSLNSLLIPYEGRAIGSSSSISSILILSTKNHHSLSHALYLSRYLLCIYYSSLLNNLNLLDIYYFSFMTVFTMINSLVTPPAYVFASFIRTILQVLSYILFAGNCWTSTVSATIPLHSVLLD